MDLNRTASGHEVPGRSITKRPRHRQGRSVAARRFLFVVPPLAAHVNPAAAVGRALSDRGHHVAWVGSEAYLRPRLGPDASVYPTGMRPYRGQNDRGMRGLKSLWDGFVVPFARSMLPAVDDAVRDYRPDAVAVDQHALAGALVAHRHGLPWASLAPTQMELTRPFRGLPNVEAWIQTRLAALRDEAGLVGAGHVDPRFSPYLLIAFTTAALTGARELPDHYAMVGPALGDRPAVPDFRWDSLDRRRRLVLVTAGTLAADLARDFFGRMVRALDPLADQVQGIINASTDAVPTPPDHVVIAPRLPMLELLPALDGVVCHGGMSTVSEALCHGVPLVIAPIKYDHPIIAAQVSAAGAGIRVHIDRAGPAQLRAAVTAILDDPVYRTGAERIRDSFAATGGASAAARRLEGLADGHATVAAPTVGVRP